MYARVSLAHKDMEPEVECFDGQTHKAEGFGELKGGFVTKCSLRMCRRRVYSQRHGSILMPTYRLLDPSHFLLPLLGAKFPMEVATGMNGRVWVDCKDPRHTIAVVRCIEAVDERDLDVKGIKAFLETLDV